MACPCGSQKLRQNNFSVEEKTICAFRCQRHKTEDCVLDAASPARSESEVPDAGTVVDVVSAIWKVVDFWGSKYAVGIDKVHRKAV